MTSFNNPRVKEARQQDKQPQRPQWLTTLIPAKEELQLERLNWLREHGPTTAKEAGTAWGISQHASLAYLRKQVQEGRLECTPLRSLGRYGNQPRLFRVRE